MLINITKKKQSPMHKYWIKISIPLIDKVEIIVCGFYKAKCIREEITDPDNNKF
jgi:hypothetical protein